MCVCVKWLCTCRVCVLPLPSTQHNQFLLRFNVSNLQEPLVSQTMQDKCKKFEYVSYKNYREMMHRNNRPYQNLPSTL